METSSHFICFAHPLLSLESSVFVAKTSSCNYKPIFCKLFVVCCVNIYPSHISFISDRLATGIAVADIDFDLIESVRSRLPIAQVSSIKFIYTEPVKMAIMFWFDCPKMFIQL